MNAITPMRSQLTASDPRVSVWVSANAGTGKTKVLTDRVLRLLLAGTPPSRILCITYTKAAAAEMENRIHHTLADWVALDDAALTQKLRQLNDVMPNEAMIRRARSLFAIVLDAPESVRIQTIHSFCQSLLRRFPLEASVSPHFEVIDDRTTTELMTEARIRVFAKSLKAEEGDENLVAAVNVLAGRLAEKQFQELLEQLVAERRILAPVLHQEHGVNSLINNVYNFLSVIKGRSEETIFAEHFDYSASEESALRASVNWLMEGAKTDVKYAELMIPWWQEQIPLRRMVHWASYKGIWLTDTGLPRQKLVTASVVKTNPAAEEIMRNEQRRCMGYDAAIRALHVAQFTEAAIVVIDSVLSIYNRLKTIHQALDYDDLILLALQLLSRDGVAPWVLYKLDGGLDHVLIDEAQDTSQEQWGVVDRLIADFFAGETARTIGALPRTLFVVGDEKQSIYSFQGASPRAFGEKRHYYADLITGGGAAFEKVELSMSFRSTSAVLDVVDAVISQPYVRAGMDFQGGIVPHEAYRTGQAGLVEVWPVTATEQQEQHTIWDVRREVVNAPDAQFILADRIAKTVRSWLRNAEMLESQNRPIRAGDILVLVRRRNAFMHHLVRAFKRCDVPVAGVDRMVLTENITVMDMLALAEFLLLPEDDLSLACVLKSPLCGLLEDDVFTLAHDRGRQSLWSRVQAHAAYGDCAKFLQQLLERVDYVRPYELFASVLEAQGKRHSFATRMGEEVFDPLDEFLTLALEYERSHAPSLQGFLHWVRSGQTEIKRDMEQGMDAVRIMTVHGSKGLQAPIVFLPDTTDTPGSRNHPLWVQHNGQPVMVWSPSSKEDDAATATLRETYKQAQDEEYRRLLYVAMTRAEDRLYVSGWLGRNRKDVAENCWYRWIVDGARELMQPHTIRFGEEETDILRHHTAQEHPAKAAKAAIEQQPTPDMPDYLRFPPAAEPYPPQPLVPSRSDVEIVQAAGNTGGGVLSPIAEQARFQRGNCIHRLLQWLPDTPPHKRMEAATTYLTQYAADMPQEQRTNMLREVLTVLEHPEMQPVFSAGSLAEVPLSGLVRLREGEAERILNGQIDRLRVTPEAVWIVDYKTQRIPPATAQEVPLAYLRQMAIYRAALAGIYPNRPVHCALLWTAAPCLMMLDADLLASSLDSGQG